MRKRYGILLVICGIIVFFFLMSLIAGPLMRFLSKAEVIREYVESYGVFAPIVFIFLSALQVIIAPVPGQAAGLVGGFIFGTVLGTIYGMIGLAIGSVITFSLARKFGQPIVEKLVDKNTLEKFHMFSKKKGELGLFAIYLLPALPDDIMCYLAGLTNIKIHRFIAITILGRLPSFFVLSAVGAGLTSKNSYFAVGLAIAATLVSILIYFYLDKIKNVSEGVIEKINPA